MRCGEGKLLFDSTIIIDNDVNAKFTGCQEGNAAVAEEAALLWIPELLWVNVQELVVGSHAWAWDVHIMLGQSCNIGGQGRKKRVASGSSIRMKDCEAGLLERWDQGQRTTLLIGISGKET